MSFFKKTENKNKKTIKIDEIGKHFSLNKNKIIDTFIELGFIEKRDKGVSATKKGISCGGYNKIYMGRNYTVWNESILNNEEILKHFKKNTIKSIKTTYKEKIKKGLNYEKFVGKHFEEKGYIVKYNGIENGVKDNSVDLIAIKKDEIIFIQCKNWKEKGRKIKHTDIKAFLGDIYVLITENERYQGYKEKRLFVASEEIFDNSAKKYCEEHINLIDYKHLPMS